MSVQSSFPMSFSPRFWCAPPPPNSLQKKKKVTSRPIFWSLFPNSASARPTAAAATFLAHPSEPIRSASPRLYTCALCSSQQQHMAGKAGSGRSVCCMNGQPGTCQRPSGPGGSTYVSDEAGPAYMRPPSAPSSTRQDHQAHDLHGSCLTGTASTTATTRAACIGTAHYLTLVLAAPRQPRQPRHMHPRPRPRPAAQKKHLGRNKKLLSPSLFAGTPAKVPAFPAGPSPSRLLFSHCFPRCAHLRQLTPFLPCCTSSSPQCPVLIRTAVSTSRRPSADQGNDE